MYPQSEVSREQLQVKPVFRAGKQMETQESHCGTKQAQLALTLVMECLIFHYLFFSSTFLSKSSIEIMKILFENPSTHSVEKCLSTLTKRGLLIPEDQVQYI